MVFGLVLNVTILVNLEIEIRKKPYYINLQQPYSHKNMPFGIAEFNLYFLQCTLFSSTFEYSKLKIDFYFYLPHQ